MKSNYPRKSNLPKVDEYPKLFRYTMGLCLTALGVGGFFADRNEANTVFDGIAQGNQWQFLLWMSAIAFGIVLVWKCSHWRLRDKAKLLICSGLLTSVVMAIYQKISHQVTSSFSRFDDRPQLLVIVEYLIDLIRLGGAISLGMLVAALPFWIAAAGIRKAFEPRIDEHELIAASYGEDALNFGLQYRQVEPQTNSAQKA